MDSRRAVKWLLIAALGLPLLQGLLSWVGGLLGAMGDDAAAQVLTHVRTAAGVLWLVALTGLLIALGIRSLGQDDRPPE